MERSVSSCSEAITNYLAAREEEFVNTVETILEEPMTFSEKVKRQISMERQSLLDQALLVNSPVNNSIKTNHDDIPQELSNDETIHLNERCSAVLRNELPQKEKDPGCFTLPCLIGSFDMCNALADLRASISIMPRSMFLCMGIGDLKLAKMKIEMADRSMQSPLGIVENVLVKIKKFLFLVDFVILDIPEDNRIPVILGRPMLATAHTKVDVFAGKLTLEANGEIATFGPNELLSTPQKVCAIDPVGSFGDALEEFLSDPPDPGEVDSGRDFDVFVNFEE